METSEITKIILAIEDKEKQYHHQQNVVSLFRFVLFILSLSTCYLAYYYHQPYIYIFTIVSFVVFMGLVILHDRMKQKYLFEDCRLALYQDILKRKENEWKQFYDDGSEYLNEDDLVAKDLDLLGPASLYQFLNVGATPRGCAQFASWLKSSQLNEKEIFARQMAVQELYQQQEFSESFMALSIQFKRKNTLNKKAILNIVNALKTSVVLSSFLKLISILCPLIMLVFIMASIGQFIRWEWMFIWASIQIIIAMLVRGGCNKALSPLVQTKALMDVYEQMFQLMKQTSFDSPRLQALQKQIDDADQAMKQFSTLIGFANIRNNDVMFILFSGLCVIDLQLVKWFHHVQVQYGNHLEVWMSAVGEMEALLSLSMLKIVDGDASIPKLCKEQHLQCKGAKHPLIPLDKVVSNDFMFEGQTFVITGSNMSGKTTFLRTLGVNMALCNAGGYVSCDAWVSNPMNIYTSMRVNDDVDQGISTFYAEILRIKTMMQAMDKQQPMLVLIDEIFKGTNSADRIVGAKEAVKRLHKPWVTTFVSTHDFELCALEKDEDTKACNLHFTEYYENDRICFDYQIQVGKCTTTNAKYLMKLAGII